MSDERTPEQIATAIREAVEALNLRLREAGERNLKVELEVTTVGVPETVSKQQAFVSVRGVYQRIEPEPKPVEAPPARQRGHKS